jgi:hypothetical protein
MAVQFTCRCGKRYLLAVYVPGKKVTCKRCGRTMKRTGTVEIDYDAIPIPAPPLPLPQKAASGK